MHSFWTVERFLWNSLISSPANSELREWYLNGWWTLVHNRPKGAWEGEGGKYDDYNND